MKIQDKLLHKPGLFAILFVSFTSIITPLFSSIKKKKRNGFKNA